MVEHNEIEASMSYRTFSEIVEEIGAPLVQFAGVFGVTLAPQLSGLVQRVPETR